jgi:transcriptional regulator with XRE-family HTH domain
MLVIYIGIYGQYTMTNPEAIAAAIARNVHAHRTRRSWTLDALATRSGVSKGMLVQIEQARTNPSIATLCRIADALGVSVPRLVEVDESPPVRIVRAADAAELWHGLPGSAATVLMGSEGPDQTEMWDWRIAPGDGYDGAAHPPGSREILYVLAGALTLMLGAEAHTVAKGDTLLFRADRPHRYENTGKSPLRFIMVVIEPSRARS